MQEKHISRLSSIFISMTEMGKWAQPLHGHQRS